VIQTVPIPANRKPDSLLRIEGFSFPANAQASLAFSGNEKTHADWRGFSE